LKIFQNSSLWALSLLLISNVFLNSCDKDKEEPPKAPVPLIASAKYFDSNDDLDYTESFQYDDLGRLTKIESTDGYLLTMEYSASAVMVRESWSNAMSVFSNVLLDSKGLCSIITVNDGKNKSIFFYDSKGYRQSASLTTDTRITTDTYTVLDGNYATILTTDLPNSEKSTFSTQIGSMKHSFLSAMLQKRISTEKRLKSATANYILKSDFLFYKDKANTIESENRGISFMGKQNQNPIMQQINTLTYNNEAVMPETITHSYEYDAKSRITKETSSEDYSTVYTYVD